MSCAYAEANEGRHDWADAGHADHNDRVFCQECGLLSRVLMPFAGGYELKGWSCVRIGGPV